MKKHELLFWIIKLPIEFFIVLISFFIARNIREITDLIPGVQLPIKYFTDFHLINFAIFWSFLFVLVYIFAWLYRIGTTYSRVKQIFEIIYFALVWYLLYIWFLYLWLGYVYKVEIPRLIVFFALFISIWWIIVERILIDYFHKNLLKSNKLEKIKIALILDKNEEEIIENIISSNIYTIVWYFSKNKIDNIEFNYLWNKEDFIKNTTHFKFDEILYVSSHFNDEELNEIFEYSRIYWIKYKYIANSFDFTKNNTETSFINKIPVVEIRSIWLSPWWRIVKRIVDILTSFVWLIILSPLFIIVSVLEIKESKWLNIFYGSSRVWKWWWLFKMYKFRSMKIWAEKEKDKLMKKNERKDWPLFKIENDPRITPLWAILRKYDIDELPQLWNVFIWNMSLIWPRPHLPEEVALYKDYQKRVLTLKPGITWMAQTHWRHKNSFDDEVKLDIFYIENWSIILDLKILFKTIKVVLSKEWR